jgi:predicted nucleotidyltransferase
MEQSIDNVNDMMYVLTHGQITVAEENVKIHCLCFCDGIKSILITLMG